MSEEQKIVSDEEVERVHGSANFGAGSNKRDVIRFMLLKCACGYHSGFTAKSICVDHGLVYPKRFALTPKGKLYLWAAFGERGMP